MRKSYGVRATSFLLAVVCFSVMLLGNLILAEANPETGEKLVSFAKLDGSEWPIVHPGLQNNGDYHATHLDRELNPSRTETGDVRCGVNVERLAANLPAVDLSGCNVLAFNLWVEDNGAWDAYKNQIKMSLLTPNGDNTQWIPQDVVNAALQKVVPGEVNRIVLPIDSVSAEQRKSAGGFKLELLEFSADKNLHIRIDDMWGEYQIQIAKLDGSEWPVVHPGLSTDGDYHATHFDRQINFTENGDVKSSADVKRTMVQSPGTLAPVDLRECNVLTFDFWVEDNGAWEAYRDKLALSLLCPDSGEGEILTFAQETVNAALADAVPGKTVRITVPLDGVAADRLAKVGGIRLAVTEKASVLNLHVKIADIRGQYQKRVVRYQEFAKLDGSEWPIVHPGLQNNGDYHATHLDRELNPSRAETGDVRYRVNVERLAAGLPAVDLSGCNVLAFNLWVEDNGAWNAYKNQITMYLMTPNGDNAQQIPQGVVNAALANVVPGEVNRIVLPIDSVSAEQRQNAGGFKLELLEFSTDKNLHIRIDDMRGEYQVEIAKLDGSEFPIVHPGVANDADYHATHLDRVLNPSRTETGDVLYRAAVQRTEAGLPAVDLSACNALTFDLWVEDNDAWKIYQNKIKLYLLCPDFTEPQQIPQDVVNAALAEVVPGSVNRIEIPISSIPSSKREQTGGIYLELLEFSADKNLHIRIEDVRGAFRPVQAGGTMFAKLDGSEWPIVHPGLSTDGDYHATHFDRYLNPNENGDVRSEVVVSRGAAGLAAVDFSGENVLAFTLWAEDNGAWADYKEHITIELNTDAGKILIPQEDIHAALAEVVPGEKSRVAIRLAGLYKEQLAGVREISFKVDQAVSDKNLHLRVFSIAGENDSAYPEVPSEPQTGPTVIAKLDGSEFPIVHPGMSTDGSYHATHFDRHLNSVENGDVKSHVIISRTAVESPGPLGSVDISDRNVLTFSLLVEDNGAWSDYREHIAIQLISSSGTAVTIPQTDINAALAGVVPGTESKVVISLAGLYKTQLTDIAEMKFDVSGAASGQNLHLNVKQIQGETDPDYPAVPDDPTPPEPEGTIIAKLDGSEWPIVHPGLSSDGDYHATHLDRFLNAVENGDVRSYVTINRAAVESPGPLSPANISDRNVLTFYLTVEDNGAWADYREHIAIQLVSSNGTAVTIPQADVNAALAGVVPGTKSRVILPLAGLYKAQLADIAEVKLDVSGAASDKDLHITMALLQGESLADYPAVPELSPLPDPEGTVIAELDGTEWPIVHPGLNTEGDYHATHFDRHLNAAENGDVKSYATISRTAVQSPGTLAPLDISAHNVLTFYLTVGDNGAWTDYRDHVEIRLNNNGTTVAIPRADVNAALTDVVPGTEIKITIPLKGLYKEQLNAIAEIWVGVTDASSEKNLHLKIRRVQAETDENYPAVPEQPGEPTAPDLVEFAKLDGSEYPIVHPGLVGEFNDPSYEMTHFDRRLNFTENGDVRNTALVSRKAAGLPAVDMSGCNVLTFYLLVEDNGAWADYKDALGMSLIDDKDVSYPLSQADIADALADVVPGVETKITISLSELYVSQLASVAQWRLTLGKGASDKNLHLTIRMMQGEYNSGYPELEESLPPRDPYVIVDEEHNENAWPASVSNATVKFGRKSYAASTLVVDGGFNEGWLIRMGYWGNPLTSPLNISTLTADGTTGAVRFWLYAENAEAVRYAAGHNASSFVRIGSSDNLDTDSINWTGWATQIQKDGWNEIVLPFAYGSKSGNPDFANITSFTIKFCEGQDLPVTSVYLDNIRVSSDSTFAYEVDDRPTISGAKMFQPFEEMWGVKEQSPFIAFGLDTTQKTQGDSSLKFAFNNGSYNFLYRPIESVDASGYNCLEFDLYLPKLDYYDFCENSLELTSSGTWDQQEMAWSFSDLKLEQGWNHIALSFDRSQRTLDWKGEPDIDLTNINFMRIYSTEASVYVGTELTFYIDNMCFTKNGLPAETKEITIENGTGFDVSLTAKPGIIPDYGTLRVTSPALGALPENVRGLFADDSGLVILDIDFLKDSIAYSFSDVVTVHLKKNDKIQLGEEFYLYRLDVNGALRRVSFTQSNAKGEIIWEEPNWLATYILSKNKLPDEVLTPGDEETPTDKTPAENRLPLILGLSAAGLVVLAGGVTATVLLLRRRNRKNKSAE